MTLHRFRTLEMPIYPLGIERMRTQTGRQRKEILLLQRTGISTASAEALLQRMLDKVDLLLCAQRD
jgi:hypothetical protein